MATILITGTNRGIGLEFTRQMLARGDRVIATCRDIATAPDLQDLQGRYEQLEVRPLDVASADSMQEFVQGLEGMPIDIFINNAGVYGPPSVKFPGVER